MRLRKTVYGRTRSDVELAEWPAIERSASGRSRPVIDSPFRVTHISLNFDVRFAALNADRNQFSNAVAACKLVL